MTDLSTSASTTIDAPAEEIWAALTTPELIERWFFGVHTETDWTVGSPIVHTGEWDGKPYVDKGEIVRFDPPKVLVHTHWSELSGVPVSRRTTRRSPGRSPDATDRPSSRSRSTTCRTRRPRPPPSRRGGWSSRT